MHDLIGAYERLAAVYRWYIGSAFPMRFEVMNGERARLLDSGATLSQPPLIETVSIYPSSGRDLKTAEQEFGSDFDGLATLAEALLPDGRQLYEHQWLKTGATLVRQWRGHTHTVLVREDGFEYEGQRYRSLTVIAEQITGAHWSGPRFFGVSKRARPS
jgi:DUF2924 family protein